MDRSDAATKPATRPIVGTKAIHLLDNLSLHAPLELSTESGSAAKQFHFWYTLVIPAKEGEPRSASLHVVRDMDKVAVVVRDGTAPSSLPYAYLTNGMFVAIDASHPGGLVMYEGGRPDFVLAYDGAAGMFSFKLAQEVNDRDPHILLDLRSILRDAADNLRGQPNGDISFDPEKQVFTIATKNAVSQTLLSSEAAPSPLGIKEWVMRSKAGPVIAVTLASGPRSPLNYFAVTKKAVEGVGTKLGVAIPVRVLTDDELKHFPLIPVPSKSLTAGEVAARRAAGGALLMLFPPAEAVNAGSR